MGSLDVYRRPSPGPHTRPELRFLQVYDEAAIATGVEVTQFAAWTGGFHGFRSINGRLVRFGQPNTIDPMLIVCPSCSTSYTIEPASLGSAGRTVRCARCKTTWFADTSNAASEVTAVADNESEVQGSPGVLRPDQATNRAGGDNEPAHESAEAAHAMAADTQSDPAPADTQLPEPVAIADAPSLVPSEPPPDAVAGSETDEIENFAARRRRLQARRKEARRSSRWTALILVLFAFNVALVGARNEVVRFLPQTASLFSAIGLPVNLRNLKFENMRISKETQEGLASLVIEGTIVSVTNKPTEVPRLRFSARDAAGQEVYTWTAPPGRSILGPGEKMEFRSRFVSPPENAVDVMVRFSSDPAPGAK
jgi:predicted Zn finger-like uncharacterized protein